MQNWAAWSPISRHRQVVIQVVTTKGDMDQMTQQNSALVEEASAAAESLQEYAMQLGAELAVFKLAQGGLAPIATVPKAQRQALAREV